MKKLLIYLFVTIISIAGLISCIDDSSAMKQKALSKACISNYLEEKENSHFTIKYSDDSTEYIDIDNKVYNCLKSIDIKKVDESFNLIDNNYYYISYGDKNSSMYFHPDYCLIIIIGIYDGHLDFYTAENYYSLNSIDSYNLLSAIKGIINE